MSVLKTTGTKAIPFKNQSFFNDFNWFNFTPGDLVHISDYCGSDCQKEVGVFQKLDENDNPVIRLLPRPYEIILLRVNPENITDMADQNFWKRFINA